MEKSSNALKTEALVKTVFELLKGYCWLTDFEMKRDTGKYGYSNPVATTFPTATDGIAFLGQFEELEDLDLHHSRFTCFANATMFEINLKIKK
ncbi:hypothetical protein IR083_07650 [Dysgonomonas sp. GY75]|uniref:hypothetical protein n=1 Tax=Dysgonomonas sp. GY75 TaxID=2780419 RepID=UPI001883DB17|nr:hypothetical protein [Dysgonomonas sp. GY75]MBF0648691.1 hypothetical protein [Dysgonomonas sp. GY75]